MGREQVLYDMNQGMDEGRNNWDFETQTENSKSRQLSVHSKKERRRNQALCRSSTLGLRTDDFAESVEEERNWYLDEQV